MRKFKLSKVLLSCSAVLTLGGMFALLNTFEVNAEDTALTVEQVTNAQTGSFAMAEGASVKNDPENDAEKSGLRFGVTMSETQYDGLMASVENGTYDSVEFGVFLLPKSYNDTYKVRDYAFGESAKYNWAVRDAETGEWEYTAEAGKVRITKLSGTEMRYNEDLDSMVFWGTIINVLPENMGLEMLGVGYMAYTVDDVTSYVFTAEADEVNNVRSMAYVAQGAIDAGEANAEWLYNTYVQPVITAGTQYTYSTEYYFENSEGAFVLDATKTSVQSAVLGTEVNSHAQEFDCYVYDETNENNVESAKVVALNGVTVLKRYYSKLEKQTLNAKLAYVEMGNNQAGIANFVTYKTSVEGVAGYTYKTGYVYSDNYTVDLTDYGFKRITEAKVGGVDVLDTTTPAQFSFAKAAVSARGDVMAVVTGVTEEGYELQVNMPLVLADILISTADDFEAMQWLADPYAEDTISANGITVMKAAGYIVLTNNISYNRTYKVHERAHSWGDGPNKGFAGTLDGRGFVVDGLEMVEQDKAQNTYDYAGFCGGAFTKGQTWTAGSGLFASLCGNATIRNIGFTNAKHSCGGGFITTLAWSGNNVIENVFVQLTYARGTDSAPVDRYGAAGVFQARMHSGSFTIQNCVVMIEKVEAGKTYYDFGAFTSHPSNFVAPTRSNVFIVSSNEELVASVEPLAFATTLEGVTKYATMAEFKKNVTINASEWTANLWTVENGIPMPKNWTLETPEIVQPEDKTVYAGQSVSVAYNGVYQVVTVEGEATVSGGVVTVNENAGAGEVIITVTDVFTGESKSATLYVMETYNLATNYVEMGNNQAGIASFVTYKKTLEGIADYTYKSDYVYSENYTVDLTPYGLDSISEAKIGSVDVMAYTSTQALTFAKSTFAANRGDVSAVIKGVKNGGQVIINIPFVFADILISTADDFEAMQWLADPYAEDVNSAYGMQVVKSAGYIVLTNNIAYNRTYKVHERSHACTVDIDGFTGTLDGRGFVVDGLEMVEQKNAANNYTAVFQGFETSKGSLAGSGLFAMLGAGGTIKNIGFTNAKHSCGGGFIVTTARGGNNTIENVYVHITTAVGTKHTAGQWNYMNASGVLNGWYHGGSFTVRDIVIKVDAVTEGNVYYTLGSFSNPGPTASNVYVISPLTTLISRTNAWGVDGNSIGTTHTGVTVYANAEAATAGKAAWTAGLTSSIWDTTGDTPVFVSSKN